MRREQEKHLAATVHRFYNQETFNSGNILRWWEKHANESSRKRAATVYVRVLGQPQLYEGNHHTGALIMSYILVKDDKAPFVLTVENAKEYFDPSTVAKETQKTTVALLMKLPGIKKRFADFLKNQANERYLTTVDRTKFLAHDEPQGRELCRRQESLRSLSN